MELLPVIEFLTRQKVALEETIECLERLRVTVSPDLSPLTAKRRGRKFMAPEDRERVSQRMKEYWLERRAQKTNTAAAGSN